MKKTRIVGVAAGMLMSVLVLSACSPEIKEVDDIQSSQSDSEQSNSQSGAAKEPQLDAVRIRRIVAGVQEVLDQAQNDNNPDLLSKRLINGALAMREGQFLRAQKTGTDLDPLEIEINVASATAEATWPRVLLVGSSSSTDSPAEVYVFSQANAQSDYMLENWVRAVGGNSVRGVAVEDGTIALPPDAKGYLVTPQQAVETYVNFLNDPNNEANQIFEDNTFAPRYRSDIDDLNSAVSKVGNVVANAAVSQYPVTSVSLANGEALVSANLVYSHTYTRTVANSTLKVGGTAASYMDDPAVIGTVKVDYLVSIFFTIPAQNSTDKVKVVGSERVITSVTKDDDAKPEGE